MHCPQCSSNLTGVVSTFRVKNCDDVVRRRKCRECLYRWYSVQKAEELVPGYKVIFKRPFKNNTYVDHIQP
jgi:transcriptional regulator NrdR family protein